MASSAISPASLNRVLTVKGYALKKSLLTEKESSELRKALTVAPKVLDKFQWTATPFPIFAESATRFYVPRHWGIKKYGEPEATILSEGRSLPADITWNSAFAPHDFNRRSWISSLSGAGTA